MLLSLILYLHILAPVSFSIKKPKEEPPKEIKSALPIEESDEEETETSTQNSSHGQPTNSLSSILSRYNENHKKETKEIISISRVDNGASNTIRETASRELSIRKDFKDSESHSRRNGILDGDDPLMEIIELTGENGSDKKDSKRGIK